MPDRTFSKTKKKLGAKPNSIYIADLLLVGIKCPAIKQSLNVYGYKCIDLTAIADIATVSHPFELIIISADHLIDPTEADIEQLYFLSDATPIVVYAESLELLSPQAKKLVTDGTFEWISGDDHTVGFLCARIDRILLYHRINSTFTQQQNNAREKALMQEKLSVQDLLIEKERDLSESIISSIGSGLLILDIEGSVILINSHMRKLFNLNDTGYVALSYTDVFVPALVEHIKACLANTQELSGSMALKRISTDGKTLQVSTYVMKLKNGDNRGLLIFVHDITEEEKVAAQLYHNEKLATIGTMLSGIAHELRNPLAIISARAQRIPQCECPGKAHVVKAFESIGKQSHRCSTLVNNLLNFTRSSTTQYANIPVDSIIEETLTYISYQTTFDSITLVRNFTPNIVVFGDRSRFVQVFLNIISNAADAMAGSGTLTITTTTLEGGFTRIAIADTGPGIPPEVAAKVFDPFFTTKDPGKGTGLGLAISQKIVAESGGALSFISKKTGTTFIISLPCCAGRSYA